MERKSREARTARSQQEELHRVTTGIIISFKTKTVFRAAVETVKIASRRILLSNKKTDVRMLGRASREGRRGEAWRRKEEVLWLADVRTDRSPSQIYSGTVLVLRPAPFFRLFAPSPRVYLTPGVLIISHPFLSR